MTYEYAVYFKLLLLCGYEDELQRYLDDALMTQNPLSELVLELCTVHSDGKKMLSVLNEYLRHAKDSDIDYDNTVFGYVMLFLKREYTDNLMPIREITGLMHQLAVCSERDSEEPWYTMYILGVLFEEAEAGYIDKADYLRKFEAFIDNRVCFRDYPATRSKETLFKKAFKKIRRIHQNCAL